METLNKVAPKKAALTKKVFEGNGRGNHKFPFGPKVVYMIENASHSIQVYNPAPNKTNIHIARALTSTFGSNHNEAGVDNYSPNQLKVIRAFQRAGYDLYIIKNGNLHLRGYTDEETLTILTAVYRMLMSVE